MLGLIDWLWENANEFLLYYGRCFLNFKYNLNLPWWMVQESRLFFVKKKKRVKTVQLSLCFSFYYQQRERFVFFLLSLISMVSLETLHYVIYSRLTHLVHQLFYIKLNSCFSFWVSIGFLLYNVAIYIYIYIYQLN